MFNGKMKAVTFSYDDAVTQDKRLIQILDKYGLKATFNINSELLGKENKLFRGNTWVDHNKVKPEEVREQVLQRLEIFSKDGGYIFNTIHNIQANTPIENIAAMVEAVKEFNGDR